MIAHVESGAAARSLAARLRSAFLVLVACASALAASCGARAGEPALPPIFGAREKPLAALSALAQWKAVLARYAQQRAQAPASCTARRPEDCRELAWHQLLSRLSRVRWVAQLDGVNRFVNGTPYVGLPLVVQPAQRWETPREFLRYGGDCMDFVIAKYFSLREMGVPASVLRIVVVHDRQLNAGHAVLAVYDRYDWYILDNQNGSIWWSRVVGRYEPVYAFNEQHAWLLQKVSHPYAGDLAIAARPPAMPGSAP